MRAHSDRLADVLTGGFDLILHVDVFHGTDRVLKDLGVTDWDVSWGYSTIGLSGSLTVVHQADDGASLIPKGVNGILSPHSGATVLLLAEIRAGYFSETIQLGWARITGYKNAEDSFTEHHGLQVVTSTQITLELQGIESGLVRDGLKAPEQPQAGATCYSELRRLTGLPVIETLPDKPAPNLTYEAKQGGRWDACLELGSHLGGTLYVTSNGGLTVHDPAVPLATTLHVGDEGTILDVTQEADTDGVYNCVVGNFEDDNGNPIYAIAEVTDGPMSVTGPYGRYTRYYASDFVKTQQDAQSAVAAILAQHTRGQRYDVPVTCVTNPLIEVGDRVRAASEDREVEGIVTKVKLDGGPLMGLALEVERVW